MNLGERIYELRSRAGLSQGELADRLDVSRQAVSKWENNSAVPELDKLLKMSELFEISLDGLVKGTANEAKEAKEREASVNEAPAVVIKTLLPPRKIAAIVLFCMAFFTGLVFLILGGPGGLLYSVPFVVFGLICLFCEKHTGIKCLWAGLFMVNGFCSWATGISVSAVLRTFLWTYQMNYGILAASWALLLFNLFVVIYTAVKLGKEAPKHPEKAQKNFIASVASVIAANGINVLFGILLSRLYESIFLDNEYMRAFSFVFSGVASVRQFVLEIIFTVALISFIRYVKLKKQKSI